MGWYFQKYSNLALFAMLGLLLVFLGPANHQALERRAGSLQIINWLMIAATVVVFGYIFVQSD